MPLATEFITVKIPLGETADLLSALEAELRLQGEPLRWAITQIDEAQRTATVEAVVTTTSPP
ncbi:MAG: hypothetical protein ACFCVD_08010 [Nodosilinea sp.]